MIKNERKDDQKKTKTQKKKKKTAKSNRITELKTFTAECVITYSQFLMKCLKEQYKYTAQCFKYCYILQVNPVLGEVHHIVVWFL